MDTATTVEVSTLIGALMPIVIDVFNKDMSSARGRLGISLILCLAVGIVYNIPTLSYGNFNEVLASLMAIIVSAQAAYKKFYENSSLQSIMRSGD